MPKVLIIDDEKWVHEICRLELQDYCEVLSAYSLKEIEEIARLLAFGGITLNEIDIIVVDACLSGNGIDTIPFIEKIKADFKGILIAGSSDDSYNSELIKAGCGTKCLKLYIARTIIRTIVHTSAFLPT
ncbi:MAG: hypothetical protein M1338_03120 [Patescibacteria group bacterium]|nr:hypothetical protein [Patescibacteria group bacterium]